MAANTGIADPWAGAAGPKIKPSQIEKTWRNDQDPTRRRATFGVPYPLLEIAIEKSEDLHAKLPARFEKTKRRSIAGVRFHFRVPNLIFSDTDFRQCKFHRPDDEGESKISGSKFKNCKFERCMLGGTVFRHVTFEGSTFVRCDFGASEFHECQFIDCNFTECTAENASFIATEVDPAAFLRGMPPPVYNYEEIPDGEETPVQVAADWIEVRRKLAAQLLRSNTDIQHRDNSDRGLFELKRAEVTAHLKTLREQPLKGGWTRLPLRFMQVCTEWLVLNATRGGTSLSRLILAAMFFVPLYALLLSVSHVTFMNQPCHVNSYHLSIGAFQQLARASSLFLAFGYTAFSGGTLATVLLTAGASLGLLWYALVAEVVIHRVYR